MTLIELLNVANSGYPDNYLASYYDQNGQAKEGWGDSLAEFIVNELRETYDDKADDHQQLWEAISCLEKAKTDMDSVIAALLKK
jgi:hypothetical protein